ncbi:hypothetical protein CLOAM1202 [Candidatus Cloacimonas acidaminovorans str. Evry]|uniref:Uncharacterized protein n=1 Tax=Cloacimonas acidaminovorans (strain Evry) TaxID=459349 RepID=B0VI87_CLOAI|nr:hypothetical protein CLOAM1202 [Candidatus Cloacimonas acidaminovorans str. Evry]
MDGYIYLDIWENGKISEKFEIFISSKNGQPLFRDIGINCSNDLQFVKKGIFDKDKHKVGCIKNINPDGL